MVLHRRGSGRRIGIPAARPGGEARTGLHVQWYWVCAGVFSDGVNIRMFDNSFFMPWVHLPPYADGGAGWFSEKPTFSIMEFYVTAFDLLPWEKGPDESVVSDLYPGKHISFGLSIGDRDAPVGSPSDGVGPHQIFGHNASWGDPLRDEKADTWADGILVGHDEDTAVRDLTWGRIKASLSE